MPSPAKHHVDQHVGARIRLRRQILKVSQGALAADLGLTFQQVQKYETGANRIAASTLHAAAKVLRTTPEWFFEGLPPTGPGGEPEPSPAALALIRLGACPEGSAMAQAMTALPRPLKRRILALLAVLAEDAD
ncbi:helix-turn-helix transcriptional regulator [uncultured Caulobacter sp.]|uniref:helix-turn-helix domain-containing protein n=1 Tax=uncultured Caulobacter sp. TaxID=158749 RepID=UPI002629EEB7|nr:helix-turn-helix transcriptional regulator [uncultured Caulobacter sp.]